VFFILEEKYENKRRNKDMASHKYEEINYNIGFSVDNTTLQNLKKNLQEIQNMTTSQYQAVNPNASRDMQVALKELLEIKKEAGSVQDALEKAFNTNLGTTNITKFNQNLKQLDLNRICNDMQKLGVLGVQTTNGIAMGAATMNNSFRESHKLLDDMARSFKNTIKWGINSSIVNSFSNSIQKAWNFAKGLDSALNDIRIVTSKSADEMDRFAVTANRAAQSIGASTRDFAEAALIYYQQGLSDEESNKRAEITLKAANVTKQSAKEVSEQLTAV